MKRQNVWKVLAAILVVALPLNVSAQGQAPNRKDVVEAVSAADPARFACAHQEGRSCKTDWIKAVAWALHQTDPRWGLNMKRDDDRQGLSMDVVTFRIGPTDRHVEAFDICGNCGGGSPTVEWNNITNFATIGNPGTARWVQPSPVAGGSVTPPVVTPPQSPPVDTKPLTDALAALAAKLDALSVKVDAVAGVAVQARDAAQSAEHDAREVNAWRLDQPPVPVLSVPCLVGRVPKAFGGSTEVTFCPVAQ